MNIVCIFGNGLDLSLGLKTSYKDFYSYYLDQIVPEVLSVKEVREQIRSDFNTWADLEIGLGAHCKNLNSVSEVDEVFFDISESLSKYLESEEAKFDFSDRNSTVFFSDALAPEKYLTPQERADFTTLKNQKLKSVASNRRTNITALTFNYTRSLEKILGNKEATANVLKNISGEAAFTRVEHIHGQLGETPILGVNDKSQIANKSLHDLEDAMEVCIKPNHSRTLGNQVDSRCAGIINQANIICIFGSSIGETDRIWWERIGNRLLSDCVLFIFARDIEVPLSQSVKLSRLKRNIKSQFLAKTTLIEEEAEKVRDSIFIGINQEIFKL